MFKVGQQIVVSRSTGVVGIEVGHTGTIVHIEHSSFFYPIHVKLDQPDGDGHYYSRFDYNDIQVLEEDDMSWYYEVEEGEELLL